MTNIFKHLFRKRTKSEINWQSLFTAGDTSTKVRAGDYDSMINAYDSWVYACVSCIARNVAKCQLHLYAATGKSPEYREIESHPFWDLMRGVNPAMNYFDLMEITTTHLDLTGNAYWYLNRNKLNKPVEVYILQPNKIKIKGSSSGVASYEYYATGNSVIFEPDEVIHFKYPNPGGGFYGMSPLQAMIYTVSENDLLHQYGFNILKNQAIPGNIFQAEEFVDSEMLNAAKDEIKQQYEGVKKAGKTMILKGIKPVRLGLSPVEIAFLENKNYSREEILMFYGVPATKLGMGGTTQGGTPRATAEALDATFQQETILPRLRRMESKINEKLLPLWDSRLIVEFENPVPNNREFELKQWESWIKNQVKSVNEYREWLGDDPVKWGDVPLVPFSVAPLSAARTPQALCVHEHTTKDIKRTMKPGFEQAKTQKWLAWVKIEEEIEGQYIKDLKKFFNVQKKQVIANMKRFFENKTINTKDVVEFIFPPISEQADKLTEVSKKHITNGAQAGIEIAVESTEQKNKDLQGALEAIGMTMTTFDEYISEVLKGWKDLFGFTINETIEDGLRDIFSQAIAEGWNVTKVQGAIEGLYEGYEGMDAVRSLRIARTEISRIMNESELMSYKKLGYEKKTWSTALDEGVCEICEPMEGEVASVNDNFSEGVACPPAHVSCRCTTLPGDWSSGDMA